MAYYDALIAKWSTLTGSTAEKLAQLNALTVPGQQRAVPVLQVMTYLRTNNLWLPIKAAVATSAGAAAAVDYNSDPRVETIDVTLPIVQSMLADLVAHNLLSAQNVADINALAATTIPWWQATVAQGGGGLSSPVTSPDLVAAGNLT
jgi:hypothetical protein